MKCTNFVTFGEMQPNVKPKCQNVARHINLIISECSQMNNIVNVPEYKPCQCRNVGNVQILSHVMWPDRQTLS